METQLVMSECFSCNSVTKRLREELEVLLANRWCVCVCEAGSSLLTGPEGLSAKERDDLKKLKALRRYRRRYGVEALLHRRLRERRQAVSEGAPQVALHLLTPHTQPAVAQVFTFTFSVKVRVFILVKKKS